MKYDVFISYRRDAFESANLIAEKLRSAGYSVFFDLETLRAGKFNEQLLADLRALGEKEKVKFDQEQYDRNIGTLVANGARFDLIGMSLYPYWAAEERGRPDADGVIEDCMANIRHLYEKFGKESIIHPQPLIQTAASVAVERVLKVRSEEKRAYAAGNPARVIADGPECFLDTADVHADAFSFPGFQSILQIHLCYVLNESYKLRKRHDILHAAILAQRPDLFTI